MKKGLYLLVAVSLFLWPFSSQGAPVLNMSAKPATLESTAVSVTENQSANSSNIGQDWLSQTQQNIAAQEYFPARQSLAGADTWDLINRTNNLRSSINETGWRMQPADSGDTGAEQSAWNYHYRALSLSRENLVDTFPEIEFGDISAQANIVTVLRGKNIEEWFKNSTDGLEHGFNIAEKMSGEGQLRLTSRINTDLDISADEQNLSFTKNGQEIFAYTKLLVSDKTGKQLPAKFLLNNADSGYELTIEVDDQAALYPIVIDPLAVSPSPNWQAESNQASTRLGRSVATAGDVNGDGYDDVIIGSPDYSNGESGEGAAFVWYGSASGLGASGTPSNADWQAESNQASALFGFYLSTAGDVNGDGYDDVIIGAYGYDNVESDEGAAFVWYGSASGLGASGTPSNADWQAESNQASAYLGQSVFTAGDVNRDGYDDVIIGAPGYSNGESAEGAAFFWYGSASGLGASGTPSNADWQAESNQAGADLGWRVSTAGDVNGDGYDDVIIAVDYYNAGVSYEGAVFVWYGSASGLGASGTPSNADWYAKSNQQYASLGSSVASGDVNGDGYDDVMSASDYTNSLGGTGSVFAWYGSASGLGEIGTPSNADWQADNDEQYYYFGQSVSLGDLNDDGYDEVIIGAYAYTSGESDEGAAFVWYGSSNGLGASGTPSNADWKAESNQASAQFGRSVSIDGNVNGDGCTDVIIGAPYYDNDESNEGAAFVYYGGVKAVSLTPANGVTGVATGTDLSITFAGQVNVNTGDITIKKYANDATVARIDVTSGQVTGSGTATITIDTGATLERATEYYVLIDKGAFKDVNGFPYGIVSKDTWHFTTDATDPTVFSLSPANGAAGVALATDLVVTFSEPVTTQTGQITVKKYVTDTTVADIDVTSSQVTGSGTDTITIKPAETLDKATGYYVLIDDTAFDDLAGNSFAGINSKDTWNFTTSLNENGFIVSTPGSAGGPQVKVSKYDGTQLASFMAYDKSWRGGFQTVTADLQGDGQSEIITLPTAGQGPHLRVFTQAGKLLASTFVYDKNFRGGLSGVTADINGDNRDEIIVAPYSPGNPADKLHRDVKVYRLAGRNLEMISSFLPYAEAFQGGVNLAAGNIDGSDRDSVVVVPSSGGGPDLRVFKYEKGSFKIIARQMAYNNNFRGGVNLVTGDLDNDQKDEIVTAPLSAGGPQLRVFSYQGKTLRVIDSAFAYAQNFFGGCNLTTGDIDGNGADEVMVIPRSSGGPNLRLYQLQNQKLKVLAGTFVYNQGFRGGVNLASADINDDGRAEIVTAPASNGGPNVRVFQYNPNLKLLSGFWSFAENFRGGVNLAVGQR